MNITFAVRTALGRLTGGPIARSQFNPGVSGRMERGGLVEMIQLPSPFKNGGGRNVQHLKITDAGREALKNADQA